MHCANNRSAAARLQRQCPRRRLAVWRLGRLRLLIRSAILSPGRQVVVFSSRWHPAGGRLSGIECGLTLAAAPSRGSQSSCCLCGASRREFRSPLETENTAMKYYGMIWGLVAALCAFQTTALLADEESDSDNNRSQHQRQDDR